MKKIHRFFEIITKIILTIILFIPALLLALITRTYSNKKNRILICGIETSSNIKNISEVLHSSVSYKVKVFQFYENSNYKLDEKFYNKNTILCNDFLIIKIYKTFIKNIYVFISLFYHDVIFINWTESFFFLNLDFIIFYIANKTVIVRHCGDDVRYRPLQNNIHSFYHITQWSGSKSSILDILKKVWRQRIAEKYTLVMSTRDHATFQGKDLLTRPYIQTKLSYTKGYNRNKPLIIHAPSDPKIKGTEIVIEAINLLRQTNLDFDFELCYGLSNSEILSKLANCIILIDQPGAVPARLAVEGLASGCIVIGGNVHEISNLENCPIIQFKPSAQQLFKSIYELLNDKEKCIEISNLSFNFWQYNFSEKAFLEYFDNLLNSKFLKFSLNHNHVNLLKSESNKWFENLIIKLLY